MADEKKYHVKQASYVDLFQCTGSECIDTCCTGWEMQLSPAHQLKFKNEAPELLDSIVSLGDSLVMKKDPCTGHCVEFKDGLCNIHKVYNKELLGDACYLYPRLVHKMDSQYSVSASLSCPEVARIALFEKGSLFNFTEAVINRVPYILDDHCPNSLNPEMVFETIKHCLALVDQGDKSNMVMFRLVMLSYELEAYKQEEWPNVITSIWRRTLLQMPQAFERNDDSYLLLAALMTLISSSKQPASPRLSYLLDMCERVLSIDLANDLTDTSLFDGMLLKFNDIWSYFSLEGKPAFDSLLLRWIKAQLCISSFPFAGFGSSISNVALVLAVRYATVRFFLAISMFDKKRPLSEDEVIEVVQPLARFMDHLTSPALSASIYKSIGWSNLSHLRGLLEL